MPQNQARGPFCDLRLPASGSFSPERPPATATCMYLPRGQLHNRAPSASARTWREGAPQYSPWEDSYVLTADPPMAGPWYPRSVSRCRVYEVRAKPAGLRAAASLRWSCLSLLQSGRCCLGCGICRRLGFYKVSRKGGGY